MKKVKAQTSSNTSKKRRPALTPEARENQMIALAVDRAEEQLMNGTASSQIIVHYLKLATAKTQLENERLRSQIELDNAKAKAVRDMQDNGERYKEALEAFRSYSGHGGTDEY